VDLDGYGVLPGLVRDGALLLSCLASSASEALDDATWR
jgi:hypothetical protein